MENVKSRNEEIFEMLVRRAAIDCCIAEGEKFRNHRKIFVTQHNRL